VTTPVDIYISLGSNIEPASNIAKARDKCLNWLDGAQMSPVYRSPPVGMSGDDFLNAVVRGSTTQPLHSVIDNLHAIELSQGRIRTANKFTDRTLDLDLLIYGDTICGNNDESPAAASSEKITLPHPEIVQQAYVLQPFADLAGDFVHPTLDCTIDELCLPEKFHALTQVTLER